MFKKCMLSFLIICLILSMNTMMFASETEETEEYIYIINPEVGTSGKAILNDTLFISIYVQSERDLVLELVKKETPIFETVEPVIVEDNVEEKVTTFTVGSPDLAITKADIISAYQDARQDLSVVETSYNQAKLLIKDIPVVDNTTSIFDESYELTSTDEENLKFVDVMASRYNEVLLDYNYWENRYLKLFETVIIDDAQISVDPSFPYFEYTVDQVESGQYKLLIKTEDGNIIEHMDFEVVSEENIADEILEEGNFFGNFINDELFE